MSVPWPPHGFTRPLFPLAIPLEVPSTQLIMDFLSARTLLITFSMIILSIVKWSFRYFYISSNKDYSLIEYREGIIVLRRGSIWGGGGTGELYSLGFKKRNFRGFSLRAQGT